MPSLKSTMHMAYPYYSPPPPPPSPPPPPPPQPSPPPPDMAYPYYSPPPPRTPSAPSCNLVIPPPPPPCNPVMTPPVPQPPSPHHPLLHPSLSHRLPLHHLSYHIKLLLQYHPTMYHHPHQKFIPHPSTGHHHTSSTICTTSTPNYILPNPTIFHRICAATTAFRWWQQSHDHPCSVRLAGRCLLPRVSPPRPFLCG
ncbi:hypothetical protein Acr_11g0004100 [Actinidia rufa]|uniref:Uncharacterized protein n=1 Tax=Actinidia rufa TaxID=165716 RepID=A0A7J0FBJ6_9ERIC|nr:hypothetical protein Acr_11g0004100 [Actinidia rufa]